MSNVNAVQGELDQKRMMLQLTQRYHQSISSLVLEIFSQADQPLSAEQVYTIFQQQHPRRNIAKSSIASICSQLMGSNRLQKAGKNDTGHVLYAKPDLTKKQASKNVLQVEKGTVTVPSGMDTDTVSAPSHSPAPQETSKALKGTSVAVADTLYAAIARCVGGVETPRIIRQFFQNAVDRFCQDRPWEYPGFFWSFCHASLPRRISVTFHQPAPDAAQVLTNFLHWNREVFSAQPMVYEKTRSQASSLRLAWFVHTAAIWHLLTLLDDTPTLAEDPALVGFLTFASEHYFLEKPSSNVVTVYRSILAKLQEDRRLRAAARQQAAIPVRQPATESIDPRLQLPLDDLFDDHLVSVPVVSTRKRDGGLEISVFLDRKMLRDLLSPEN